LWARAGELGYVGELVAERDRRERRRRPCLEHTPEVRRLPDARERVVEADHRDPRGGAGGGRAQAATRKADLRLGQLPAGADAGRTRPRRRISALAPSRRPRRRREAVPRQPPTP